MIDGNPMVLETAVVAKPDPKWGEVPVAFVTLKQLDANITEGEVILFVRERLEHFKVPRHVVFGPLPKTSKGKIRKRVLSEIVRQMDDGQL